MSAGKGDKPRNCFSKNFKENYDKIKWSNCSKGSHKKIKNKICFKYDNNFILVDKTES